MLAGYSNLVSGLLLREYSPFLIFLMGIVAVAELSALVVKLWRAGKAGKGKQSFALNASRQAQMGTDESYFALDEVDEEEEDEDGDGNDNSRGA